MRRASKRCGAACIATLLAAWAASVAVADKSDGKAQKGKAMGEKPHSFTLKLTCDRAYLAGFPILVEVEVHNIDPHLITGIPYFDLFTVPGPVRFGLSGGGRQWTWEPKIRRTESGPDGVDFGPGQSWSALQDLSELHPDLPPGHYQLTASMAFPGEMVEAKAVALEIASPSAQDKAIAAKLRAHIENERPSWLAFVRHNWSTPASAGLSAVAHARLAFHLFLHRVAYGPKAIGELYPETPWQFGKGILEGQAALSRLEILYAAGRPEAPGVEMAIVERWPGLAWWIAQIRNGRGPLTNLRTGYGVESEYSSTDKPRPYSPGK